MAKSRRFKKREVARRIHLYTRRVTLPIAKIPTLSEVIGPPDDTVVADCKAISPLRTLYVVRNGDGLYGVVSDAEALTPEIRGSPATFVEAVEIERRADCAVAVKLVRVLCRRVDSVRGSLSNRVLVRQFVTGTFDALARRYVGNGRATLRGYTAFCALFGTGQMSKSTFYRWKKKFIGKQKPPRSASDRDARGAPKKVGDRRRPKRASKLNRELPQQRQSLQRKQHGMQEDLFYVEH